MRVDVPQVESLHRHMACVVIFFTTLLSSHLTDLESYRGVSSGTVTLLTYCLLDSLLAWNTRRTVSTVDSAALESLLRSEAALAGIRIRTLSGLAGLASQS